MDRIRIKETMDSFYIATHVPIVTFSSDKSEIHSYGYTKRLYTYFEQNNIKNKIFSILNKESSKNITTITSCKNIYFTAIRICPRKVSKDVFIFGPYSCNKDNKYKVLYKPQHLIPHYINLLNELWKDHCPRNNKETENTPYSLHIKKAIDFINNNYQEDLKLDQISAYLKVSKCYFCSLFKSETGKTFTQFLNEVRIEGSKKLLKENTLSMLDIALSVGFNNQNYYNIIFKRITNKTPSEYRNYA